MNINRGRVIVVAESGTNVGEYINAFILVQCINRCVTSEQMRKGDRMSVKSIASRMTFRRER